MSSSLETFLMNWVMSPLLVISVVGLVCLYVAIAVEIIGNIRLSLRLRASRKYKALNGTRSKTVLK